jgi:hypothetical protein
VPNKAAPNAATANREIPQGQLSPAIFVQQFADITVVICALLWFAQSISSIESSGFSAAAVLLLTLLYWSERAWRVGRAWAAHFAFTHAGAFFITLLAALRVGARWFAFAFALVMPVMLFALGRRARALGLDWLGRQAHIAAAIAATLAFLVAIVQAMPHLRVGDLLLLAPYLTLGLIALEAFIASLLSQGRSRVSYFRAGLFCAVVSFALACLRAGFDPLADVEIYTSPVAVALLLIAHLSVRREWADYESDTSLLLWTGSLLLCLPLLFHALEFRLLLDVPAPWRDLGVLCASLALVLFGVLGRMRAPVLVGMTALLIELAALALTSVNWLQVPLKVYLITVGSLLALVGWMLEFRREQLIAIRNRLKARRELAREHFGEWR